MFTLTYRAGARGFSTVSQPSGTWFAWVHLGSTGHITGVVIILGLKQHDENPHDTGWPRLAGSITQHPIPSNQHHPASPNINQHHLPSTSQPTAVFRVWNCSDVLLTADWIFWNVPLLFVISDDKCGLLRRLKEDCDSVSSEASNDVTNGA